jgi:hypothetical protein
MDAKDTNTGNDGFIWAGRVARVVALVFAAALAVVNWMPLAAPIEWEF